MDTGFQYDRALNQHAISFQTSAIASTSEMIMMGDYYLMNNRTAGTRFSGNSGIANSSSGFTQPGNSCGSVLADSVQGLKHDAGLAVEWSVDEQHKLEEGLSKYANEPSIMRYIKIAATLRDKTVRDVALRCRWMARKRRKQDEPNIGKKLKEKKDNLVESSSKPSISSLPTFNVAPFSVTMNNQVQIDGITFEALSGSIRHLLEQNNQVLGQISANISSMKLQDNIDLFSHMKNNITAILNDMRYMPGPPLPVSLNDDLAHSILPTTSQTMMFEASSGMYMKQEPGF
ncbi:uncharacterized protein LOC112523374 isoform X2 [Cynara cardunculus var. scolymus]|uniref:Homeodomain-like protein n=1 Tax=Cynara cardunculus var. scolymus TaxID=59895 RepID=A0A103XVB8_CYNCS|nr:uncharacterized protein LOC112523374 isoform X2 [Cynara cardunculus var. scolymus]KVH97543.1 Protein of unknown function DUF3755 [Cynara cardunculus var. scolymus]